MKLNRAALRDFILGSQDGLVNVLALVLGVATATNDMRIVIIAGLAATFAESISMAAVAYTSTKAAHDYYEKQHAEEWKEVKERPEEARREIKEVYYKKGFRGPLLAAVIRKITSNKKVWVDTMMTEELKLSKEDYTSPIGSAKTVGIACIVGSLIPIAPFILSLPVSESIMISLVISIAALFVVGAVKARTTTGTWWKSGIEIAGIGTLAAIAGYLIGSVLGAVYAV